MGKEQERIRSRKEGSPRGNEHHDQPGISHFPEWRFHVASAITGKKLLAEDAFILDNPAWVYMLINESNKSSLDGKTNVFPPTHQPTAGASKNAILRISNQAVGNLADIASGFLETYTTVSRTH